MCFRRTQAPSTGPYKIQKTAKVSSAGGFDYVYADSDSRRLHIPRTGDPASIAVYNLDALEPLGRFQNAYARGAAVSTKSGHGFGTSKPVSMWDPKTVMPIKTIDVQGGPNGIMYDSFNDRVWVFSHIAPNATAINAAEASSPALSIWADSPSKPLLTAKIICMSIWKIKAVSRGWTQRRSRFTARYDRMGKGGTCAGLAMDVKNRILFATCRNSQNMVILKADDGTIIMTPSIGQATDGAVFNPNTMEAFGSHVDGTLTIVKENSPTNFVVEQTLQTMPGGKTAP